MAYQVIGLSRSYGELRVLDGLDLAFAQGSVTVVLGPSGCGKTTLLNVLAGIDKGYEGRVDGFGDGRPSYLFQEDRLLPWMDAAANVAFVLRPFMEEAGRLAAAAKALEAVGLGAQLRNRPHELSGGMRRRVALARAFAYPSKVVLLDEPFSSLDLKTRIGVMDLFLELRAADARTAVVVTHDVREAIYLGDSITTLSDKPARVRDRFDIVLSREERSYADPSSAETEARLYRSILS